MRKIAMFVVLVLAVINALNLLGVLQFGWLVWPTALVAMAGAAFVITTPTEKDLGNG